MSGGSGSSATHRGPNGHGGGASAASRDDEGDNPLRLVTYNVRYFGHATRGIATTSASITRIAKAFAALDPLPDLICLQEVETQSLRSSAMNKRWHPEETQLDRLMIELHAALAMAGRDERYTAYYFPAHAYRLTSATNIYTTGLAVIARDTFTVAHHNAGRPHDITHRRMVKNLKQTRICAHVSFKHESGRAFDVFNTHLSLPNVFAAEFWTSKQRMGFGQNQLREAKTLADFIEQERRSEMFIVVGDFNSMPGSPVDRYLREERGLVDALAKALRVSEVDARAWPTAGFMNLRMALDHVYSCEGLEWLDFEETQPFGKKGPFAGLSDHVPLIGRFRLPGRRT
jgi:endonuclease/exonuclease/phosphatase family metal-dependent hydrolase